MISSKNLHQETRTLGAYTLVGLSYVPPTPFHLKDFGMLGPTQPEADSERLF